MLYEGYLARRDSKRDDGMERGHHVRLSAKRKSLLMVVNRSLSVLRTLADRDVRAPASTLCIQLLCDKSYAMKPRRSFLSSTALLLALSFFFFTIPIGAQRTTPPAQRKPTPKEP